MALFLDDLPGMLSEIRVAMASQDSTALGRASHALKGSVSNFGARYAFEAALRLEKIGGSGDLSQAVAAFAQLEQEFARLEEALRTFRAIAA